MDSYLRSKAADKRDPRDGDSAKWRNKRRKKRETRRFPAAIERNIREIRRSDRSVGRSACVIYLILSWRDISVDSLDLHNQILIREREMSGNIFLSVSSEVRATSIRLVLSPRPVLLAILCARDVDEMSSRLIFLWLMWTLINNSFLMNYPCVLREYPSNDGMFQPDWIARESAQSFANVTRAFHFYQCKNDLWHAS